MAAPQAFSVDAAVAELRPLIGLAADASLAMPDISTLLEDDSVVQPPVTAHEQYRMLEAGGRVAAILRDAPRCSRTARLAQRFAPKRRPW